MAVVACDVRMRAFEIEIRLQIMVKDPFIPSNRVMAGATLSVEIASMGVIILMA